MLEIEEEKRRVQQEIEDEKRRIKEQREERERQIEAEIQAEEEKARALYGQSVVLFSTLVIFQILHHEIFSRYTIQYI